MNDSVRAIAASGTVAGREPSPSGLGPSGDHQLSQGLVEFFRGEGNNPYGRMGDYEGWSTEQTAVHFLREHLSCCAPFASPIPMILTCPSCGERHIDEGEFADKQHHTHACQGCGMVWRPAKVPTVGVQFLPGFKNEEQPAEEAPNGNEA